MKDHKWNILEEINLSKNLLLSIDVLNMYPNLKILIANNCYIEELNLSLPKLQHLDVNSNNIKVFPVLTNMLELSHLDLGNNKLTNIEGINTDQYP
jgi:Leucine-rich repeat (LRR) protein